MKSSHQLSGNTNRLDREDKCYGHRVSLRNSVSPADLVHRYCHAGYSSIHADKLLATSAVRNLPLARWLLRIRIRRSGGL
jgi:hypothetical protein